MNDQTIIDKIDRPGFAWENLNESEQRNLLGSIRELLAERATQPAQDRCCEHDSDCAIHNAPAYPVGPCDCTLREKSAQEEVAAVRAVQENPHAATLPDHETIVRQSGELICTACGTTTPAPQPSGNSCDSDWFWNLVIAYTKGVGSEGKALVSQVDAWKDAACAVAREEGLRSIPAGHHPDCTELRRQDHEQACRVTHALMAGRDSYRQRVAIAEEAWRAAKTRADQADEDAEREKEFSHYMETRARAAEAKLAAIQSQAAGDKPTGCTHNCNQGRNCTCG